MPSVSYSRDKRGYEHVYLVETPQGRGKRARPRLLYWFRTPPGVKVGREPFDDAVQRALEAQNPHLTFDWRTLKATPMPAVEIDWRERRRAAKLAKAERAREVEGADTSSGLGPETLEEPKTLEGAVAAGESPGGPGSLSERRAEDAPARRRRRRSGRGRRRTEDHPHTPELSPGGAASQPEPPAQVDHLPTSDTDPQAT